MAITPILVGSAPNDGTGDTLLAAANKINSNLNTLWSNLTFGLPAPALTGSAPAGYPAKGTVLYGVTGLLLNRRIVNDVNGYFALDASGNLVAGPVAIPPGTYTATIEDWSDGQAAIRKSDVSVVIGAAAAYSGPLPTLWLAPTNLGTGDGSSAANAKSFFTAFATGANIAIAAGTDIGVIADQGPYTLGELTNLTVERSGASGNPIKMRGVATSGRPMAARIEGWRYPYVRDRDPDVPTFVSNSSSAVRQGALWLKVAANISHWVVEDVFASNCLNAFAFLSTGTHDNWTFNRCHGRNLQRFLEHVSTASLTNFTVDVSEVIGYSKQAFRIRGNSSNWLVKNFVFDGERQDDDAFEVGTQISETAHDLAFQDGEFRNSHQEVYSWHYANADGLSSELGNYNISTTRCTFYGNTDGGVDTKAYNWVSTDDTFALNKRNVRVWGETTFIRPTFGDTRDRVKTNMEICVHLAAAANTAPNRADLLIIGPTTLYSRAAGIPPISIENNGSYTGPAIVRLVNVTEPNPERNVSVPNGTIWRAASLPVAAPVVTGTTAFFGPADKLNTFTVATDQPCIVKSISGPDASLFTPTVQGGLNVTPAAKFTMVPTAYTGVDDTYNITLTIEGIGRLTTTVAVSVVVSAFSATPYIAAMTVQPTSPRAAAIHAFVDGMVMDNNMKYFDTLWIALHDEQATLLNLIDPNTALQKNGSFTLTPNLYYSGDGSTGYLLDTKGYVYTGANFSQNNAFMGAMVVNQSASTGFRCPFGSNGTGRMDVGPSDNSQPGFHANDSVNNNIGAAGSRARHWTNARLGASGAAVKRGYIDGVLNASYNVTSSFPSNSPCWFRSSTNFSNDGILCGYKGGNLPDFATLDAMISALHARLNTLKTALAA